MAKSKGPKFYAVARGRVPGIYNTWKECQDQTSGYSGAIFKSFPFHGEAKAFINANGGNNSSSSAASKKRPREISNISSVPNKQARKLATTTTSSAATLNSNFQLQITIHFDGGSRGNPGVAGAGAEVVVVETNNDSASKIKKTTTYLVREYCGNRATNNYAEYKGLLAGLKQAKYCIEEHHVSKQSSASVSEKPLFHLQVYGDSNLIIQQLRGAWQCKNANIKPLFHESQQLIGEMKKMDHQSEISLDHVYREQNKVADALANEAMDRRESWMTTKGGDGESSSGVDGLDDGREYIPLGNRKPSAKKPPAVVASQSIRGKNGKTVAASSGASSKQEVIDVDDSDNDSHYSV